MQKSANRMMSACVCVPLRSGNRWVWLMQYDMIGIGSKKMDPYYHIWGPEHCQFPWICGLSVKYTCELCPRDTKMSWTAENLTMWRTLEMNVFRIPLAEIW